MPLPSFKNEAEFRESFIQPLLARLGYISVTHSHGPGEQGKDFYFADYDKFENLRYYSLQAKIGNIGAGSTELDKMLNQVRRSFAVTITDKTVSGKRISAVYIAASGTISQEARKYITNWCNSEHYGENVYYLDADRLSLLNVYTTTTDDATQQDALCALTLELAYNVSVCRKVKHALLKQPHSAIFYRCRTHSMDEALISINFPLEIPPGLLLDVSESTSVLNELCAFYSYSNAMRNEKGRARIAKHAQSLYQLNLRLMMQAAKASQRLRVKRTIRITVASHHKRRARSPKRQDGTVRRKR